MALAAAAFATASPLAKGTQGLSFAGLAAGRCAVAAAALLALAPAGTWRAFARLSVGQRVAVVGAGLLLAAHFALFLGGLLTTSLAAGASLVALEPVSVVLAAWMAFGARPTTREVLGIVLATAGAALVARGAGTGEHRLLGDALVLAAVAVYGAYVAFARGLRDAMPPWPYAACIYTVAAVALAPLALALDLRSPPPPAATWAAVAALGLVPTLVGHTLVQRAARHVPAPVVALASPGETVGSIVIGAAIGRPPAGIEWIGAAVIVAGATVTLLGRPQKVR